MSDVRIAPHVHSTWSYDGQWSLAALARAFGRLGYDAVLLAEHDRGFDSSRWSAYQEECAECSTHGALLIPGIEYSDADNVVHTLVWGEEVPFLGEARDTLTILQAARAHDAVTVFAHPWRKRAFTRLRPEWRPVLSGIEIWNRKYDGFAPRAEAQALADSDDVAPFVALDFHGARQFFPLALKMSLSAPPTPASVVQALRDRAFDLRLLGVSAPAFTSPGGVRVLRSLERIRRGVRAPVHRLGGQVAR